MLVRTAIAALLVLVTASAMAESVDTSFISESGVYKKDGRLYIAAVLPWDGDRRRLETRARLSVMEYFAGEIRNIESGVSKITRTKYALDIIERVKLGAFNASARMIESRRDPNGGANYRMVVALDISATEMVRSRLQSELVDPKNLLRIYENPESNEDFFLELGLFEIALAVRVKALAAQHRTANVLAPVADPIAFRESILGEQKREKGGGEESILQRWPGDASAVNALISKAVPNDPLSAPSIEALRCGTRSSRFADRVAPLLPVPVRVPDEVRASPIINQVWACLGFVVVELTISEELPRQFKEILQLFSAGTNLERAIELCFEAVAESPRNATAWIYLAAALQAGGRTDDARVASRAAFMINPQRAEALANLIQIVSANSNPSSRPIVDAMLRAVRSSK
jgi:tetratricopeptide (TPR) repeat protein